MSHDPADVRRLVRSRPMAVLSTLQRDGAGWPHGSLVATACDQDASPVLLLSDLAEHTQNLEADGRCSLLFEATAGLDEPLTGPRVTLLGRLSRDAEPRLRRRFLARHPAASAYAGFGDFAIWRMQVERAHLVAGFGRIQRFEGAGLLAPPAPDLVVAEADIVTHMNADHAAAVQSYASLLGRGDLEGWAITGCDPDGLDLRRQGETLRLDFPEPVSNPSEMRQRLVELAKAARPSPLK